MDCLLFCAMDHLPHSTADIFLLVHNFTLRFKWVYKQKWKKEGRKEREKKEINLILFMSVNQDLQLWKTNAKYVSANISSHGSEVPASKNSFKFSWTHFTLRLFFIMNLIKNTDSHGITYLLTLFLPALFDFSSLEKFINISESRKLTPGKNSEIEHK